MMNRLLWTLRVAFAAVLLAPCAFANEIDGVLPEVGIGLPHDVSKDGFGSEIDWLIKITLIFITILFVIMVIWMLYAVFRHNEAHQAEYDHGDSKHSVRTALLISAFIFAVVDGTLWVKSTKDTNGIFWNHGKAEREAGAVHIEVNAHQWAWDARYAGPDGKFNTADDIVTLNDIRVPMDAPVVIQLASTDVIHSFYLPNFRVKQDAMPGQITRLWFQAREPGKFDIGCAQHCGINHYKMKARLTVLPREEYDAWAKDASAASALAFDEKDKGAHWGWDWKPAP